MGAAVMPNPNTAPATSPRFTKWTQYLAITGPLIGTQRWQAAPPHRLRTPRTTWWSLKVTLRSEKGTLTTTIKAHRAALSKLSRIQQPFILPGLVCKVLSGICPFDWVNLYLSAFMSALPMLNFFSFYLSKLLTETFDLLIRLRTLIDVVISFLSIYQICCLCRSSC